MASGYGLWDGWPWALSKHPGFLAEHSNQLFGRLGWWLEPPGPVRMSNTNTVPAEVPSLHQSSRPVPLRPPTNAEK